MKGIEIFTFHVFMSKFYMTVTVVSIGLMLINYSVYDWRKIYVVFAKTEAIVLSKEIKKKEKETNPYIHMYLTKKCEHSSPGRVRSA